jgi:hypothetical protein
MPRARFLGRFERICPFFRCPIPQDNEKISGKFQATADLTAPETSDFALRIVSGLDCFVP